MGTMRRLRIGQTCLYKDAGGIRVSRVMERSLGRCSEVLSFCAGNMLGVSNDRIYRLLDAAANRACEALRVVEDGARFVLDDGYLTAEWKGLRHELMKVLGQIPMSVRCAVRETQNDVGVYLRLPQQARRENLQDVVSANLSRLQESLRSLEEGTKLIDEDLADQIESLRYRSYTLAAVMQTTRDSHQQLKSVRLCVLLDGGTSQREFCRLVDELIEAGVGAIQLRDKMMDDCDLLDRAQLLAERTANGGPLFFMNDRPDLAMLSGADGVHLGQTDLSVKQVRQIAGADCLVGVSTHNIEQARKAVLDGANYLGVGPVFASPTKRFSEFPGLPLVEQIAGEISLPAFAIGGLSLQNANAVLQAGAQRLAVASAVTSAPCAAEAVAVLMELLERVAASPQPTGSDANSGSQNPC